MSTTIVPLATYRNETAYPFCPGCGHGPILDQLNEALVRLNLDPKEVVLVSDIGCSGLSDQYFATSGFHGLHGRSLTYATGIKLARPELEVIVTMGDGGTGIGGAHFLNAARRNVGMTVLVFNNLNFGMTGGQHSTTTPSGAITSTTPGGNLERPLDICATAAVNGAAYVYRGTNFDPELTDRIVEAIETPGFSILDIWELCTAYFAPSNRFGKRSLEDTQQRLGLGTGVLERRNVAEYAEAYRKDAANRSPVSGVEPQLLESEYVSTLDRPFRLLVMGSAGGKVRSAARMVAEAAIRSGLHATQSDDYPITVKTGHSVSELILSPDAIDFTGIDRPDLMVILSEDGLAKSRPYLAAMTASDRVVMVPELPGVETGATVEVLDLGRLPTRVGRTELALVALTAAVVRQNVVSAEALRAAAGLGRYAEKNLAAIAAGIELSR
ncbi:MAG TPA: thiamine pyrophosphate-dependent enzyme [Acidimicrobiia bacterium]|nr:thiamine pyrophosphate-dependent enzyme [Acidimicrobiia bacterium]